MPYVARRSEPRTAVGAVAEPGQTGAKRARPAGRTRLVRLRREASWVLAHKGLELILSILTLKVLTTVMRDDPAAYGEFNLALTGTVLLANVTLVPANQAYLRYYHTAAAHGAARGAATIVVRWYAWATGAVALACGAFSVPIARAFGLEPWTLLATGLVFLTNRWRTLGIEILEVARARRQSTLRNLGFLALQLVAVAGAASLHAAKATAALLAYAFAAGVFAYTTLAPWLRSIQGTPDRAPSGLGHLIVTYGVPAAVLLQCQWVQSFADRYILGTWTDLDAVGRYVAAYQVCGVPYMLLMGTLYALFVPIAYERAQNVGDAQQVWAGDRVILASVVVYALVGGLGLAVFLRWGGPILRFFTAAQFSGWTRGEPLTPPEPFGSAAVLLRGASKDGDVARLSGRRRRGHSAALLGCRPTLRDGRRRLRLCRGGRHVRSHRDVRARRLLRDGVGEPSAGAPKGYAPHAGGGDRRMQLGENRTACHGAIAPRGNVPGGAQR